MMRPIPVTRRKASILALRFVNNNLRVIAPDCYCHEVRDVNITNQNNHIFTFSYTTLLREDHTFRDYYRGLDGIMRFREPVHYSTYKVQKWTLTLLVPYGAGELLKEVHYVDHDLLEEEELPSLPRKG
jgi:hypothetical protein